MKLPQRSTMPSLLLPAVVEGGAICAAGWFGYTDGQSDTG